MPTDTSVIKRVCFLTSQTKVIQTVIEVYCSIKAGKTKKTIKEIINGYDEKFKSIDASKKIKDLVHKSGARGSNFTESDYKIFQDFKGLKDSKSIFRLIELSNGLIASGDCENLIILLKKEVFIR